MRTSAQHLKSITAMVLCLILLGPGCAMRRVEHSDVTKTDDFSEQSKDGPRDLPKDRMMQLTEALSQATARIEELDAKLAALSDKVEAQKIAVDNVLGTKPLTTQTVGAVQTKKSDMSSEKSQDAEVIAQFRSAMSLFQGGKYSDAVLTFNQIVEKNPDHILAGSAQFQAGESYFRMGEYKLALNEYGKVITTFLDSPRAASALVRISHCYKMLGNDKESMRTAELARDMYFGNPSLDWPTPTASSPLHGNRAAAQENALKTEPMESGPAEVSKEEHSAEQAH